MKPLQKLWIMRGHRAIEGVPGGAALLDGGSPAPTLQPIERPKNGCSP